MNDTSFKGRRAEILLVEDNDADAELVEECFALTWLAPRLHRVTDGRACMDFLRRTGDYRDAPRPDLVLLDLNTPLMDGREVLAEVLADPALPTVPIVVLTSSSSERDVSEMYRLRCSSYICKPVGFLQFQTVVRTLTDYWFRVAVLPSTVRGAV